MESEPIDLGSDRTSPCDDRSCAIIALMRQCPCVAALELHDQIVDWMALDDTEWNRTVVVIDRLATLGSSARMPLSKTHGDGLFELRFTLARRHDESPTGAPRTVASSC
jgi:hypothetical protein